VRSPKHGGGERTVAEEGKKRHKSGTSQVGGKGRTVANSRGTAFARQGTSTILQKGLDTFQGRGMKLGQEEKKEGLGGERSRETMKKVATGS